MIDDNDFKKFSDLIETMRSTPAHEPGPDFIDRVMQRLADQSPHRESAGIRSVLLGSLPPSEYWLFFIIVGVFNLVTGIILKFGFQQIGRELMPSWFLGQPAFAICAGLLFIMLGILLNRNGGRAIPVARLGIFLYIAIALMNGVLGSISAAVPVVFVFYLALAGTGIAMGLVLGLAMPPGHQLKPTRR